MRKDYRALLVLAVLVVVGVLIYRTLASMRGGTPDGSPSSVASTAPLGSATPRGDTSARSDPPARAPLRLASGAAESDATLTNGAFEGRVASWGTGLGLKGAAVTFARGGVTSSVTTSEGGAFRFLPSEPGLYEIALVAADGYLPFAPAIDQSPMVLTARPGERIRDIVIYLTPAIQYTGIVQTPSREPVAGAEVRLLDEGGGEASIAPLPDRFTSDERGEFRFSAPDDAILEARREGYSPGRARVDFSVQASRRVVLRLRPRGQEADARASIAGRVVDQKGAPLEGAHVIARSERAPPASLDSRLDTFPAATSDDEGKFTLETREGELYTVAASHGELATAKVAGVRSDTQDLTITLKAGATLRGAVRDNKTGAPVAAFTVSVLTTLGPLRREAYRTATLFDAQGRYEVVGLAPGDYAVTVAAHGYAGSPEVPFSVPDPPADPAPIDVALSRGGRVTGTVLEEKTRNPIEGARVSLEGASGPGPSGAPLLASTTTDAAGRFELAGLGAGFRSITVVAANHHGRIVSGLAVTEGGDIGPITVELAKTEEGEEPRIELTGIGAVLSPKENALVLGQVLPGGGAAEAGLAAGDAIVRIDGAPVVDLGVDQAIQRIRGPEGSTVALGVLKAGGGEPIDILVTRRRVRP